VELRAAESAANGARPAGSVQFEVGGTDIGSPAAVNASGVATTTTTFGSAGPESVTAVFMPADPAAFTGSSGTLTLPVNPVSVVQPGTIPLAANVSPAGAFTLTVGTADTITLAVSGSSATAATTAITVSETRNTYPGWSVSGQSTNWTSSDSAAGASISGNQLGWTPTSASTLPQGVTLGSPVAPDSPGLGSTPAVLASAPPGVGNGFGTATLGANLTLLIPAAQAPGSYTASLTISAVESEP
jgi:Bacterial Ig-like domain (group 3)